MGQRAGFSTILIMGAVVLLISIAVGNSMGNRVLGQIAARAPEVVPTPMISASADPGGSLDQVLSVRHSVLSVATDPGFPDPRVTPEPPPPVRRTPAPRRTSAPPRPSPSPSGSAEVSHYTSPPLPIPIVVHSPNELSDPNGEPLPADTSAPTATSEPSSNATPP
jgi:hypothetical protein